MTASTTITASTHARRPRLIATLLTGGIVCALALGAWSIQRDGSGQGIAPNPATGASAPAADPDAGPVIYLIGSDADREVLQAFTAQVNQDRLGHRLPPLADEIVVGSVDARAEPAETYLAFLGTWQAGLGRELRVADLR